jgi:hypothetical protein
MEVKTVIKKNPRIVARKSGDEYILVPITDNVANMEAVYTMNSTAAFIWDNIDGEKTLEDIAGVVSGEYDTDMSTALDDVVELVNDLVKHKIVSV